MDLLALLTQAPPFRAASISCANGTARPSPHPFNGTHFMHKILATLFLFLLSTDLPWAQTETLTAAAILKPGQDQRPAATRRFFDFLYSPTAREILTRQGYRLP